MACTSHPRSAVCSPLRHSSSHEMHAQTAPQKKHCGQRERFQGFLLKPILISSISASYLPKINSSILHVRRNSSSSREKSDREILKGTLLYCTAITLSQFTRKYVWFSKKGSTSALWEDKGLQFRIKDNSYWDPGHTQRLP